MYTPTYAHHQLLAEFTRCLPSIIKGSESQYIDAVMDLLKPLTGEDGFTFAPQCEFTGGRANLVLNCIVKVGEEKKDIPLVYIEVKRNETVARCMLCVCTCNLRYFNLCRSQQSPFACRQPN